MAYLGYINVLASPRAREVSFGEQGPGSVGVDGAGDCEWESGVGELCEE